MSKTVLARVNRRYCEALARAFDDTKALDAIKKKKVTWTKDRLELEIVSGLWIVKQRSSGRSGNERHVYYIRSTDPKRTEQLVQEHCNRSHCLRWVPVEEGTV